MLYNTLFYSLNGLVLIRKPRIKGSMFTVICIPSFLMDRNCTIYWWKYWVVLNPGLDGMGSNMHIHYCPWTEPAIFSYLSCSVAFKVPFSSILISQQLCLCGVAAVKCLPVHSISAVISYVIWRSLITILAYFVNSTSKLIFVLIFKLVYRWVVSTSQPISIWILFNHPKNIFPAF
jgi:hypothetical protein